MRRLIPGLFSSVCWLWARPPAVTTRPTPTTPTTPTTPGNAITEPPFTGTLKVNGAATYPFTATSAGTITATLASITPDASVAIGLSIGTWTGSACQIVIANDNATQHLSLAPSPRRTCAAGRRA